MKAWIFAALVAVMAGACAKPVTESETRANLAACLHNDGLLTAKRWPPDREMKVLVSGRSEAVRLARRSLLRTTFERIMAEMDQTWSFTDDPENADALMLFVQEGQPLDPFAIRLVNVLYENNSTKADEIAAELDDWRDDTNFRLLMHFNFSFSLDPDANSGGAEEGAEGGPASTVDFDQHMQTMRRLTALKGKFNTPNAAFARVSAFLAVAGLGAVSAIANCESYEGIMTTGQGLSDHDRIFLSLIR